MFRKPNVNSFSDLLPAMSAGKSIPRLIHQVYSSRDLPPILQANVEKIKALNPGWSYRFYDDNDMVDFISSEYNAGILRYYTSINPKYGASRADLFRYLLMFKVGGMYLDIKGSLEKPLDEVIRPDDVYLLSRWRNGVGERYEGWGRHGRLKNIGGEEFQQWHIIAAPGHPFLLAVIERVLRNIESYNPLLHGTGKDGVLRVTGPIAYTQSVTPLLAKYPYRLVDGQQELGLVYSIFGTGTMRAHKSVFAFHYTALNEPVARVSGLNRLVWRCCGPIKNRIFDPLRKVADYLLRRVSPRLARRG